jgi:hypothetical protein
MLHVKRNSFLRRSPLARVLVVLLAVATVAPTLIGCTARIYDEDHEWETFVVSKYDLPAERRKLARIAEQVLVLRKYYPTEQHDLAAVGERGYWRSAWNDYEARKPQASHTGRRYRVWLQIREGAPTDDTEERDPVLRRMEEADTAALERENRRLSVGIAVEAELNTRMNYIPGEIQRAEWKYEGLNRQVAVRLMHEIRDAYREVSSANIREPGEGSSATQRIIEERADRLREAESDGSESLGPEDQRGSNWDFGTDAVPER